MTSRFRGELTVVPPVRIAVRRTGLETTIDWNSRGADRGLSNVGFGVIGDPRRAGPLPTERYLIPGTRIDFGGGNVATMTSSGLSQFKELLLATQAREREIRADVKKARMQHAISWTARALAWTSLVSVVSKSVRTKATQAVALRKNEISTLRDNLAASRISISFDMETAVAGPHLRMLSAFDGLATSQGSWVLKMSQQIDRVRARSMSNGVVDRQSTRLARNSDPLVDTADCPLALPVQNGRSTAYFYPGFVLVIDAGRSDFALIDLRELDVSYSGVQFTETERTPGDARLVGKVWAKSNKNGTRDRRFKDNRELPVMLYGEMSLRASGGFNEAFMFSRNEDCQAFVRAIQELKRTLASTPTTRVPDNPKALT
ncbi:hypothetical protein [Sphingomonas sp. TREG-RG-20F-R18-01]|uniref:hypothetical protein n=1 Tax=Sphingomonas sp. TREG-RG-20F-R18-01 TaxID=2914982 RepID=UPI001F5A0C7E|nr:hypothetical protein [Sphingomonas sp. TREG-RG-20F-R18-01]